MNKEELTIQLTEEGLRLAGDTEAGWYYIYINTDGERVTVWVTDL